MSGKKMNRIQDNDEHGAVDQRSKQPFRTDPEVGRVVHECRCCGGTRLRTVVDLGRAPVANTHVDALIASRRLGPESFAVEVASNDGYLLRNFVAAGIRTLGIDPSAGPAAA